MQNTSIKPLLVAFSAGAVCTLILPKLFLTVLGATVLWITATAILNFSHKEC